MCRLTLNLLVGSWYRAAKSSLHHGEKTHPRNKSDTQPWVLASDNDGLPLGNRSWWWEVPPWVLEPCERGCYSLNVCAPPEFIGWNSSPQCDSFGGEACGRWLSREGGALKNGVVPLEERHCCLLSALPWGGHREKTALSNQPGALTDTRSAYSLFLDFPASRSVKYTRLLFAPPSLWHCAAVTKRANRGYLSLGWSWPAESSGSLSPWISICF